MKAAMVQCEVSEGPRDGWKAIGVRSVEGFSEYFSIEDRFLAKRDGEYVLPVLVLGKDPRYGTFLVKLPVEADSGANLMWINGELILNKEEVAA